MTEETRTGIGDAVRCPVCAGLSDEIARDDGDLTCSFCRGRAERTRWTVGTVRDLYDDSPGGRGVGLVVGGEFVPATGSLSREGALERLRELREGDPDGRYVLVPDREPDDNDEPPDPDEHGYDDHFDEPYSPGFYS